MKKNTLLLIVIVIVLGVIAAWLALRESAGTLKGEYSDFAVEDTGRIAKIVLKDKGGQEILLEKKSVNYWTLNQTYQARLDAVQNLLMTVNRLSVKTPVPKKAFESIVKQIAGKSVRVELFDDGASEPFKVFYVGGPNQEHTGTYMLMENSTVPFLMHIEGFYGYLSPRFFTNPNEWRNTAIFAYDYGTIASVEVVRYDNPIQSFRVDYVDDNTVTLSAMDSAVPPITMFDTVRALQYLALFQKIHYEGFEETKTPEFIDSVKTSSPIQVYTVTDMYGNARQVKTYLKPAKPGAIGYDDQPIDHDLDRLYGLVDGKDFVVLQYFVFDPLDKQLADFLRSR